LIIILKSPLFLLPRYGKSHFYLPTRVHDAGFKPEPGGTGARSWCLQKIARIWRGMSDPAPPITIALCTHNGATYLRAQLDIYLTQTHEN
jgi:hypothetical protein